MVKQFYNTFIPFEVGDLVEIEIKGNKIEKIITDISIIHYAKDNRTEVGLQFNNYCSYVKVNPEDFHKFKLLRKGERVENC